LGKRIILKLGFISLIFSKISDGSSDFNFKRCCLDNFSIAGEFNVLLLSG